MLELLPLKKGTTQTREMFLNYLYDGKNAAKWTRLSCCSFAANAVRLQLHPPAYNLASFLRTLALPDDIEKWSLTSLREKLVRIGGKLVVHGRYMTFQMAEVAVPRDLFRRILQMDQWTSTRATGAMLSHSALSHVPTNGRTASEDALNGENVGFRGRNRGLGVAGGEIRRYLAFWLSPAVLFWATAAGRAAIWKMSVKIQNGPVIGG